MKFYRTSHLEDYPPKQINSSRRPAALKRPTTTGYSNNERSKTFVIDVSDVGTHVKLSTTHASHQPPPLQPIPQHSHVAHASDAQMKKVSTPAARQYHDCASNNTMSYQGKNWGHVVPSVDALNPLPSGYSLNTASIQGIGGNDRSEFGTSYNNFERGYVKNDIDTKYSSTLSSETAFSKGMVEPPCLGVGTDDMRVFIGNQGPYKHHKYANGQPRMTYRRGVDASTLHDCARHDDKGNDAKFIREEVPTVDFEQAGNTMYSTEFQHPESVRAEKMPWSTCQTGDIPRMAGMTTGRYALPATMTAPLPSVHSERSETTRSVSRDPNPNVLLRTGTSTYSQQFVRHPV